MALTKLRRGVLVEMTPAEEAAFIASRIPTIERARADKLAAVRAKRIEVERAGAASGGRVVSADPENISRLLALKEAATPGQQVPVELVDGSVVMMPGNAITGLITAAQARLLGAMVAEAAKREEIEALTTVDAVLAYDVSTGWPA